MVIFLLKVVDFIEENKYNAKGVVMPVVKIPTLHYMVDSLLVEPEDKVIYLVRHFIYNPGFTSTLFADYETSFRGIATRYPMKPQAVADHIIAELGAAIKRAVPDLELKLDVQFTFKTENSYALELNVTDVSGASFIPTSLVEVTDDGIKVTYKGI